MRQVKIRILISLTVLGILIFSGLPFLRNQTPTHRVETVGVIEATEVNLAAKMAERIDHIPFQEGDRVSAGSEVVRLSRKEIEAELKQAQAALARAGAAVASSRALLAKADAIEAEAARNHERIARLAQERLVSPLELDRVVTRLKESEAEVNLARAGVASAEAEVAQREAEVGLVNTRLAETVILSPISGVVTMKAFEAGEMVSPGATIVTLADPDRLWVRADLEETKVGSVAVGDLAEIRVEALAGERFSGRVSEIGVEGEFATRRDVTRGRQDIRTFRVKVRIDPPHPGLKPGMTALILVPAEAPSR